MSISMPLSRRGLLRGVGLTTAGVALNGCGARAGSDSRPTGARDVPLAGDANAAPPRSGSDVRLLHSAIADEHALLLVCLASLRGRAGLRPVLSPLVAEQRLHVSALRAALTVPGPRASNTPRRFRGSHADALNRVRSAVLDAQNHRRDDALAVSSGLLARLLASVSASHAVAAAGSALRP